MKIKALVSFAGAVTMNVGEVREVEEKLAASLISCGLAADDPQSDFASEDKNDRSETPANVTNNHAQAEGDNNENLGNNGRGRKKGA